MPRASFVKVKNAAVGGWREGWRRHKIDELLEQVQRVSPEGMVISNFTRGCVYRLT